MPSRGALQAAREGRGRAELELTFRVCEGTRTLTPRAVPDGEFRIAFLGFELTEVRQLVSEDQ